MDVALPVFAALTILAGHLSANEAVPPDILRELASEKFADREESQKKLLEWAREDSGARVFALLELLADEDPEISKRCSIIARQLSDEDYLSEGQGYLGIRMGEEMLQAGPDGKPGAAIRIDMVMKGSPADESELKPGDLIIALDGKPLDKKGTLDSFREAIAEKRPLTDVVMTIQRKAPEPVEITVRLGKRPLLDLSLAHEDLQALDKKAKDEHFRKWLERLDSDRE